MYGYDGKYIVVHFNNSHHTHGGASTMSIWLFLTKKEQQFPVALFHYSTNSTNYII